MFIEKLLCSRLEIEPFKNSSLFHGPYGLVFSKLLFLDNKYNREYSLE